MSGLFTSIIDVGKDVARHKSAHVLRDQVVNDGGNSRGYTKGDKDSLGDPNSGSGVGSFIAGTVAGALAGGALGYRSLGASTRVSLAKSVSKLWKAPELYDVIASKGVNRGTPGAVSDLMEAAHNLGEYDTKAGKEVIKSYSQLTKDSTTEGLATIGDFLSSTSIPSKLRSHVSSTMELLASRTETSLADIHKIHIQEGVVKEGDKLIDYRSRTLGGMFANVLEMGHRYGKIPFTSFAPTDMFLHKAWANQHKLAVVGKGAKIAGEELQENSIVVGSDVIGASGKVTKHDKPLHIIQEGTSLGFSSHVIRGTQKYKSEEKLLADGDFGPFSRLVMRAQMKMRNLTTPQDTLDSMSAAAEGGDWNSLQKMLDDNQNALSSPMFSPTYAHEHSVARNIRVTLQKLFHGKKQFNEKPSVGEVGRASDKYIEEDLTFFDKIGAMFRGDSDKYKWVHSETGEVIGKGSLGPIKTYGKKEFAPAAFPDDISHISSSRQINGKVPTTHTAVSSSELVKSVGHFLAERPVRLFEQLTGLGIKPSASITKTILAGTVGAGALLYGAMQAAQYTDFLAQGAGSKALAVGVGGAQVGASGAMSLTGISTAASMMEDALPGSVHSFASQLARTAGLPIIGAYLGEKYLSNAKLRMDKFSAVKKLGDLTAINNASGRKLGGILGVAAAFASTMLVDPTQDVGDTYDEAVGDKRVAVRNARYWFIGRTPYGGDKIKYHEDSLSARLWDNGASDYTNYGSQTQKWMHAALPTPTNLFGLIPLLDPYHVENQNPDLRPYPVVSAAGGNIPVIGPVVQATIGNILKPEINVGIDGYTGGSYGKGGAASALGYQDMSGHIAADSSGVLNQQIGNVQDYTGLFGFMSGFPLRTLTGSDTGFGGGIQLESSDNITDIGRNLEELNLGGGMGQCFVAGTKVLTPHGRVSIESLRIGDEIVSGDGTVRNVVGTLNKVASKLHILKIANIGLEIRVTPNHWIPVVKFNPCLDKSKAMCVPYNKARCSSMGSGYKICRKRDEGIVTEDRQVSSISEGDYVKFPIPRHAAYDPVVDLAPLCDDKFTGKWIYNTSNDQFIRAYELIEANESITRGELREAGIPDKDCKEALHTFRNGKVSRISRHLTITMDVAHFIGWYIAEGNCGDHNRVSLSVHKNEERIILDLYRRISHLLLSVPSVTYSEGTLGIKVRAGSKALRILLPHLVGEGAHYKFISNILLTLPISSAYMLFRGVLLGDGFVSKDGAKHATAGYTTVSEQLARDVFSLGLSLGYQGCITSNYVEVPKEGATYPQGTPRNNTVRSYIQFKKGCHMSLRTLCETGIYYTPDLKKDSKMFVKDGYAYFRVVSNTSTELQHPEPVYDIEVEDLHYYIVEQMVVHNTELARRLFPTRAKNTTFVNPLQNAAPSWLPGTGSMFEADHDFSINFHQGDVFTKVEKGDVRLPGRGYEHKRGLNGGDNYSATDIYNILSDVAPGSAAHAHYKGVIAENVASGFADADTVRTFNMREAENVERLKGKYDFVDYTDTPTTSNTMGGQMKEYLGYLNDNIKNTEGTPLLAPLQGAWDLASHFQIPGMGQIPGTLMAQGKFLHNRTATEEYVNTHVTGKEFADWTTPYSSFIEPIGFQAADIGTSGQFTPASVTKRREVDEYFDKLAYVKSRRLQGEANAIGNTDLSARYSREAHQTVVGMDYNPKGINKNIFQAVPYSQKPFVGAIAKATPNEVERWKEILPKHQLNMWGKVWEGNNNTSVGAPAPTNKYRADEEVADYFSQRQLPDEDSSVWNPDVSLDEYKMETYGNENLSYYDQGIPEAKAREYRQLNRVDLVIDTSPFSQDVDRRNQLYTELQQDHTLMDTQVTMSSIKRASNIYHDDPARMEEYNRANTGRF